MIEIRKAKKEDSRSILEVNVDTWFTAYTGIISNEYLQYRRDTIEEQIKKCEMTVEKNDNVYVAELDNRIVGIMSYGPGKDPNYHDCGEIYTLYVLKEYQGIGIGTSLFMKGMQELKSKNYNNIIVNCLKENNANEFYKKMGGKIVGTHKTSIGNEEIDENTILYDE